MAGVITQDGSLGTKNIYRQQLDKYVLPLVGNIRCREFSIAIAERALRNVEQHNGRSIAKTVRTVLSNICAYAARHGAMDRNPVRDTSPINTKPQKGDPKALDVVELKQLRAFVTYFPRAVRRDVPAVIDFMAATGKRVGEVLAVTADALDIENRTVEVRGTVARYRGVGLVISREPKTEAGFRTLGLPEWIMPMVELHLANAVKVSARVVRINDDVDLVIPPTVLLAGRKRSEPPAWLQELFDNGKFWTETISIVFPSAAGTLRDPSNTSHDIKEAFGFAGLSDDTSHILRKSVATQMDDARVPVREIADQLGHARTSMTQDFYLGRKKMTRTGAAVLENLGF